MLNSSYMIDKFHIISYFPWHLSCYQCRLKKETDTGGKARDIIILPEPRNSGGISVVEALLERRSTRNYKDEALTLAEVYQ